MYLKTHICKNVLQMTANYRKTLVRYLTATTVVLMSLISVLSCKNEEEEGGSLTQIVITSPESGKLTLVQGETGRIKYTTVPEEAAITTVLEWSSEDENVATVNDGRVKGIAPGNTVITAKCESVTASVDVSVTAIPVTSFSVPSSINAYLDMLTPVGLTIEPVEVNAGSLEWISDNPEIAEVVVEDGNAFIRSHKEGTCTITVKAENLSKESKIKVAVYQTIYKLLMRTVDGEVEDLKDGTAVDVTGMSLPDAEGHRVIEMVREDDGKLTETNVDISSDNTKVISVTKKLRSERKVLIYIKEESSSGSAKISVSLKESGNEYKRTFTINKGVHAFTSATKICRAYTEIPVAKEEIMSPGDVLDVQVVPAVNAKWTSSNEKIAKVKARTEDGTGFAPIAEVQALTKYGTAVITATDETGKNSLSFQVNVAKPPFPAGTKIGYYDESGKLQPVGTSTSIRATYDGRYMVKFALMDASGNVSTYDEAEWSIDSSLGKLEQKSGVYTELKAVSSAAFTGNKTGILTCTDYAGNKITHNIVFQSPVVFGKRVLGAKVDGQILYGDVKVDIGKKSVVALYENNKVLVSLSGLRWYGTDELRRHGNVYGTLTSANTTAYFEFTPKSKMESVKVTVKDEIGQEQSITIRSAKFRFPEGAKIYYTYDANRDSKNWKESIGGKGLLNNNGPDGVYPAYTYFKVATSPSPTNYFPTMFQDWYNVWSDSIHDETSKYGSDKFTDLTDSEKKTFSGLGIYAVNMTSCQKEFTVGYIKIFATDDYGDTISETFATRRWVNYEYGVNLVFRVNNKEYPYDNGKDVYIEVDSTRPYCEVILKCESQRVWAISKYEMVHFPNGSEKIETKYNEHTIEFHLSKSNYGRIRLYDDYGNTKDLYIKRK